MGLNERHAQGCSRGTTRERILAIVWLSLPARALYGDQRAAPDGFEALGCKSESLTLGFIQRTKPNGE